MTKKSKNYFYFKDSTKDPPGEFHCPLDSKRCKDHILRGHGRRCKNRTVIGLDYCRAHLRANWGLDITTADNPSHGVGLRAVGENNEVVFQPNEFIAYYNGEQVTERELGERYGDKTGAYASQFSVRAKNGRPGFKWLEDAACQRGIGALVNHKPPSSANATLSVCKVGNDFMGCVRAIKPIRANREIFLSYGRNLTEKGSYKLHEDGVQYTTSRKKPRFV